MGPRDNRKTPKDSPDFEIVAGTIGLLRSRETGQLHLNLTTLTGRDAQHLPNELKSHDYGAKDSVIEPLDRILTQVGTWADPRSGGYWNLESIALRLERSPKTLQRNVGTNSYYAYINVVGTGNRNRLLIANADSLDYHRPRIFETYSASLYQSRR